MRKSAGLLLFRITGGKPEFFLVHPGGPFWKGKEKGAWSIPKGEFSSEDPLQAARREFLEETGVEIDGDFQELSPVKLKSGKMVYAWAVEGEADAGAIRSNSFPMEWPPKSGRTIMVPEVDKAGWFDTEEAREMLNPAQVALVNELIDKLGS